MSPDPRAKADKASGSCLIFRVAAQRFATWATRSPPGAPSGAGVPAARRWRGLRRSARTWYRGWGQQRPMRSAQATHPTTAPTEVRAVVSPSPSGAVCWVCGCLRRQNAYVGGSHLVANVVCASERLPANGWRGRGCRSHQARLHADQRSRQPQMFSVAATPGLRAVQQHQR